ncbi:bone marrow stromal antigen 2-like isoform X2 [Notamacropus eugenii]|uniref:bone marrow stromal antigen 2-like isoform X2 n=1 Tax=Notamacropus eugenii TaxID=9315 RepID=UPI003B681DD0
MYFSMKMEWKNWLAISAAVVIFFILVPLLAVYAYRANSKACQQGLLLQNRSQLLQEKLRHSQENFLEMEAKWWSCSNVSITLNKNLEEMTSQRDLMHSELQKLKERKRTQKRQVRCSLALRSTLYFWV